MFLKTLTVLLSLAGAVTPYPSAKRADGEIKIYAYGTNISGLQLYGGNDGKAYIATEPAVNLTEVVWHAPSADATWNVSINNNTADSANFYIVTSSSAYEPAGFQRANDTVPAGASMEGFTIYGSQVMWVNGASLESKFWAQSTSTEGVYKLTWNVDNDDREESVPVTIKTMGPS